MPIDNKARHLVVGFGATGRSIAKALRFLGVQEIWAMDSRSAPVDQADGALCTKIVWEGFDQALLAACDYLWLSPGVPLATPALKACLERLSAARVGGDIELFARLVSDEVVGISGTNGKSTVTTLVADMFSASGRATYVGGNLGKPALELWLTAMEDMASKPIFVLELSSFQLETTHSLNMRAAALLNIAPDHLDRYVSFAAYAAAKFTLFTQAQNWVSNGDDPLLAAYIIENGAKCQGQQVTFSLDGGVHNAWSLTTDAHGHYWLSHKGQRFMDTRRVPMGGRHNMANVLAACALATLCGVEMGAIKAAIEAYHPLPHRCVLVREVNGVRYYNDSKATNIPSTEAAIKGFSEPKWLILGGVTKGQDFSLLTPVLDQSVKHVVLIGLDVSEIVAHIPKAVPVHYGKTLADAVAYIYDRVSAGDIVLFSPACASMDQFKDYNQRGDCFINYINDLK